jgi:glycosyltransferase involved in cell wall biosynthesis
MSKMPAVSIVMPIYNAEPYLTKALESVLGQTFEDIQVVCVNDGSKDSSLATMKEFAAKDDRILILDQENGGYGHAMNSGIAASTGEYIGILEPDDYILPMMLEKLYSIAKQEDLDFIRSNYNRMTTDENGIESFQEEKIANKPEYYGTVLNPQENLDLFNVRMENWTGIYKADFIKGNNIVFNESPGAAFQDNGFWFQTYCLAKRIYLVDEAFYCYRVDNAASSINQPNKVFTMLDEYQWMENWLRNHPELCERFMGVFEYKKTHNSMFAFSRLADEYRGKFLARYSEEYRQAFSRGDVDESLFWDDELAQLKQIVFSPTSYLRDYRKNEAVKDEFNKACASGKVALFNYYVAHEGLKSALKHALNYIVNE